MVILPNTPQASEQPTSVCPDAVLELIGDTTVTSTISKGTKLCWENTVMVMEFKKTDNLLNLLDVR